MFLNLILTIFLSPDLPRCYKSKVTRTSQVGPLDNANHIVELNPFVHHILEIRQI